MANISEGATRHVHRNLVRETQHMHEAWESFDLSSLERFTAAAKSWLGDKTELSSKTINSADYAELLLWFRQMAEWKPRTPEEAARSAVGKEVRHHKTGELVGWMLPHKFVPVRRDLTIE